jgi:hypothetical protein
MFLKYRIQKLDFYSGMDGGIGECAPEYALKDNRNLFGSTADWDVLRHRKSFGLKR